MSQVHVQVPSISARSDDLLLLFKIVTKRSDTDSGMMEMAVKLENIEEIDLTSCAQSRSPSVDGDDDALVRIQPKQYRRLRFPPGCPVVRTCMDNTGFDIIFGVVKHAHVHLDTGCHVYTLDSDPHLPCPAQELHYGRKAPIWLHLSDDVAVEGLVLNSVQASPGADPEYCVQVLGEEAVRHNVPSSLLSYRSQDCSMTAAQPTQLGRDGSLGERMQSRRRVCNDTSVPQVGRYGGLLPSTTTTTAVAKDTENFRAASSSLRALPNQSDLSFRHATMPASAPLSQNGRKRDATELSTRPSPKRHQTSRLATASASLPPSLLDPTGTIGRTIGQCRSRVSNSVASEDEFSHSADSKMSNVHSSLRRTRNQSDSSIKRIIMLPPWADYEAVRAAVIGERGVYHKHLTARTKCIL